MHYTSVEAGPTGLPGFQFVAETPDLPAGLHARVAPYLTYRPPPDAPLAPTPEQIRRLPVSLAYDRLGARSVLARCVYLGQDYSGRYGNFLGHAVVAGSEELVGLRPVEFWQAPFWSESPRRPAPRWPSCPISPRLLDRPRVAGRLAGRSRRGRLPAARVPAGDRTAGAGPGTRTGGDDLP
nr:hypothetical protein GCM10020093_111530 [Planobispora longispora]